MISLSASFIIITAMIGLSIWANRRFQNHDRLPMQWSLTGKVNWSAPRLLALSFYPAFAIALVASFVGIGSKLAPRPGQEALAEYVPAILSLLLLAIQCGHFWGIGKTVR